jgi:hypothetical protein
MSPQGRAGAANTGRITASASQRDRERASAPGPKPAVFGHRHKPPRWGYERQRGERPRDARAEGSWIEGEARC